MPRPSAGISGTAVGIAVVGGILIYAGFRDVSPLQALRDVASGNPAPVQSKTTSLPSIISQQSGLNSGDPRRANVVASAQKYIGDTYSQAKRTLPGFSDCSSFVDKALRDAGISPPFGNWANTAMYRLSPEWRTIPADQSVPGDIAISLGHMVLVTGNGGSAAIGQQRPGVNVKTGSVATLMGSQSYVYKAWTGFAETPGASEGSGGQGKDKKAGGSW